MFAGNVCMTALGRYRQPGLRPGISKGVVGSSRSVVVPDAPPYTIVGGNPAKPIKQRFEPDVMARLNEVVWCDWPIEKVSEHLEQFVSGDIEALRARAANA
jgi:virginiamycin A acetyltransferase